MKSAAMMFLAGAIVASGLVVFLMRPSEAPPQPVTPVEQTALPTPAPEATEVVPEPVAAPPEPARARPSAMPRNPEPRRESKPRPAAKPEQPAPVVTAQNTPPPPQPTPRVDPTPMPQAVAEPQKPEPPPPPPPPQPKTVTIPAGTLLSVRVDETLRSDRTQNGDSFRATLDQPLVIDGFVIAERGARVEGRVSQSDAGGRVRGVSSMTLELVRLNTADGQRIRLQTEAFNKQGEKDLKGDATKVGVAAGIGAAIGAIAGGGKGAAIGAGVGGAAGTGGVMATRGKPVEIPAETRLSFRLREPITITEKL